jgi:hypothetical protein
MTVGGLYRLPLALGRARTAGAASLSHTTGEVTHHIAPDIDAERVHVIGDIGRPGQVAKVYVVEGFPKDREGRNGGGDSWHTDGSLLVAVLALGSSSPQE